MILLLFALSNCKLLDGPPADFCVLSHAVRGMMRALKKSAMKETFKRIHTSQIYRLTSSKFRDQLMTMTLSAILIFLHRLSECVPAMLITAAVGILIACALGCTCAPCREKDRLFKREVY
jgi:MFS superfamily sulfate permease-like transporter